MQKVPRTSQAQTTAGQDETSDPPIIEKIAKTYGLGSFGQVEAIRYT